MFSQGESKEVDAIAASQERIQVLSGLIQGNSPSQIRQQIGLPPKLLPAHAKPKKIQTTLTKLKATEAKLMKILRRKQTDAILSDMRNVFDPENGSRGIVDTALNGYLTALYHHPSNAMATIVCPHIVADCCLWSLSLLFHLPTETARFVPPKKIRPWQQ